MSSPRATLNDFDKVATITPLLICFICIYINQENTVVAFQIVNFHRFVDALIGMQVKTMQVYRPAVLQGDSTDLSVFTIWNPVGIIHQRQIQISRPFITVDVQNIRFVPMPK